MFSCYSPFTVINDGEKLNVPCGKCANCLKRRAAGWSFRMLQELKGAYSAKFITLTYETTKVPLSRAGRMDLSKRDLQLFFKRLRKAQGVQNDKYDGDPVRSIPAPIKYYSCGEYGGETSRPHYHVILFNASIELIQPAWNLGHIHYGDVSPASVGYCLKYMLKRKTKYSRYDDREREFSLMSKGLGSSYLSPGMLSFHKLDLENRMCCNLAGNKKIAMPRYYKDKIYSEQEREKISEFFKSETQKQEIELCLDLYSKGKSYNDVCKTIALGAMESLNYRAKQSTFI
ncbi:replication initiator protein [Microvirus D_HF4_274]|nr:replication initiator protein [Microvirus D_HF4_274]